MARILNSLDPGFENVFRSLLAEQRSTVHDVDDVVTSVLEDVRVRGDAALLDCTERFDGIRLGDD